MSETCFLDKKTLAESCAEIIYENIINMKPGYAPGNRLNVFDLAEKMGVSETPLKMAFKLLESKGVLNIKARKGTYIVELTADDIEELLDVRSGLECMAVQLIKGNFPQQILDDMEVCVEKCNEALAIDDVETYREMDEKIHVLIIDSAHNKRLKRLYKDLLASEKIIYLYSPKDKHAREESTNEHKKLLQTFQTRKLSHCITVLQNHWMMSRKRSLSGYLSSAKFGKAVT